VKYNHANLLAYQNKFILFEPEKENLTILDDSFNVISTVTLKLNVPLKNQLAFYSFDSQGLLKLKTRNS
jgi:hypothetical protein